MTDITMCVDKKCKKKKTCYRYNAPTNPYWQSYFLESPREKDECEYYWERSKRNRKNV